MTSTTPSYLKRVEQSGAEGLYTMENGAEASTVVFCLCACIRAGSSLFSCLRCSARASVCGRPLSRPLFIQCDSYAYYLSFSFPPPFLSLFYTLFRFRSYVHLSFCLSPICFAYFTFSLYMRARWTCSLTQKRHKLFYTH